MQNFSLELRRAYIIAEQERRNTYAFLGLHPIKKPLRLQSNTFIERIEDRLKQAQILGEPVLPLNEVNFLNAYTSWYDFFNDVKSTVVKPLVILWLSMKHTFQTLLHLFLGISYKLRGQERWAEAFSQAVQSFLKAFIYAELSWKWMVVYAQLLSMASRILMTIPSLVTSCRQEGCEVVARRSFNGFSEGFYSMFSRTVHNPPVSEADRGAAMREGRERAFR